MDIMRNVIGNIENIENIKSIESKTINLIPKAMKKICKSKKA